MTNLDKVSAGLSEWAFKVAKSVLPQVRIPANSQLGHVMGMLGMAPESYNVWNELGFLAEPVIRTLVTPAVTKALGALPDDQLPEIVEQYADAFLTQAREKGSVNLFGLELGADAFEGLKDIMNRKFS